VWAVRNNSHTSPIVEGPQGLRNHLVALKTSVLNIRAIVDRAVRGWHTVIVEGRSLTPAPAADAIRRKVGVLSQIRESRSAAVGLLVVGLFLCRICGRCLLTATGCRGDLAPVIVGCSVTRVSPLPSSFASRVLLRSPPPRCSGTLTF
jgi:hypothetical protein